MNDILARVKEVLAETGKTQQQLEDDGVASQQSLSKWKRVEKSEKLTASSLAQLAIALGINGHWLLTGQGNKRTQAKGGDAVYAAGRRAGRLEALRAIEALPAISGGSDEDESVSEVLKQARKGVEAQRAAQKPKPSTPQRKHSG